MNEAKAVVLNFKGMRACSHIERSANADEEPYAASGKHNDRLLYPLIFFWWKHRNKAPLTW